MNNQLAGFQGKEPTFSCHAAILAYDQTVNIMLRYLDVLFPSEMLPSLGSGHLSCFKKSSLTKMQELALLQMFDREQTRGDRDLDMPCGEGLRSHSDPSMSCPFNLNTPQHCRNTMTIRNTLYLLEVITQLFYGVGLKSDAVIVH